MLSRLHLFKDLSHELYRWIPTPFIYRCHWQFAPLLSAAMATSEQSSSVKSLPHGAFILYPFRWMTGKEHVRYNPRPSWSTHCARAPCSRLTHLEGDLGAAPRAEVISLVVSVPQGVGEVHHTSGVWTVFETFSMTQLMYRFLGRP